MLTLLKDKYLCYDARITEDIFNEIKLTLKKDGYNFPFTFSSFVKDFILTYGAISSHAGIYHKTVAKTTDKETTYTEILGYNPFNSIVEKKIEFKVGNWYKFNKQVYIKYKETKDNSFVCSERIVMGRHFYIEDFYIILPVVECTESDLEYIAHNLPLPKEFVLPKKWCVKPNNAEEDRILSQYRGGTHSNGNSDIYMLSCKLWLSTKKYDGDDYTEITFEQFKQYVLKEPSNNLEPIGTLICTFATSNDFKRGKEYPFFNKTSDERYQMYNAFGKLDYYPLNGNAWKFELKEPQEYFPDLSKHIGRKVKLLVNSPIGGDVKAGDIGTIMNDSSIKFSSNPYYCFPSALNKDHLGKTIELLPKEIDWTKEELLAEAKRRYPVGIKFKSAELTYTKTLTVIHEPIWGEYWIGTSDNGRNGLVYKDGKWAEIISEAIIEPKYSNPIVQGIELIPGEIYKYGDYIFEYCNLDKHSKFHNVKNQIDPTTSRFMFKDAWNLGVYTLSIPTEEEKQWQKVCAKAVKFIPKEEALKMNEPKFEVGKYYQFDWSYSENITRFCKITKLTSSSIYFDNLYDLNTSNIGIGAISLIEITNIKELTKQEFIDIINPKPKFEAKESELDIWLKETKAKNLSLKDLTIYTNTNKSLSREMWLKLEGRDSESKAQIIYDLWNPKVEEVIPEYVECIRWDGILFKAGVIYPIINTRVNNNINVAYYHSNFKPSTKEAFDAQNKPKDSLKRAVYCKTQAEWDIVCEKHNSRMDWIIEYSCFISHHNRGGLNWCKEQGYTVISFEEWCKENILTFKPKDTEFPLDLSESKSLLPKPVEQEIVDKNKYFPKVVELS